VVLTTGCDKTTPSQLMAAATVNIPAIALSVGPMLNGWYKGERAGSGTIKWAAKKMKSGRRDRLAGIFRAGRLLRARRRASATRWARRRR
jgi:dihydroxy-acid dehydratase